MNDSGVTTRRTVLGWIARAAAAVGLGGLVGRLLLTDRDSAAAKTAGYLWQIDPAKCIHSRPGSPGDCGRCQIECVLSESAVKCVHAYAVCGYCELCSGYFPPDPVELTTAAENQLCPTGAIQRSFVEDPYYEYAIDEPVCIGCGKCVTGCNAFGNGSLFLQIRHDRCVNCNDCTIARACPAGAITRIRADRPYILKGPDAREDHAS